MGGTNDSDGGTGGDGGVVVDTVTVSGSVQKGPFILGSSIAISALDGFGNPTGQVFITQTNNDRGEFAVEFPYLGPVSLVGEGFYFNEVTGALSTAPITLRAFHDVTTGGEQNAFINFITHLSYGRAAQLVNRGASFVDAVAQAEDELRAGLGIGPPGFDPLAGGIEMNVLGVDTDANAYLLAVSAVLVQAASLRGGPIDASLQEIGNGLSADLADDGLIDVGFTEELLVAQRRLNPEGVMANLEGRFGSAVPNINRILDVDVDGVVNATDNCHRVSNTLQEDADSDGIGDACEDTANLDMVVEVPGGDSPWSLAAADINGDGKLDLVVANPISSGPIGPTFGVLLNMTAAGSATPAFADKVDFPSGTFALPSLDVGDFNGDGLPDVALVDDCCGQGKVFINLTAPGSSLVGFGTGVLFDSGPSAEAIWVADLNADGKADLAAANRALGAVSVLINTTPSGDPLPTFAARAEFAANSAGQRFALGDLNDDDLPDVAVSNLGSASVTVLINTTSQASTTPTFAAPASFATGGEFERVAIGDLNGDAILDVAVAYGSPPGFSVLLNSTPAGAPSASFATHHDIPTPSGSVAIGDLNEDGLPDIAGASLVVAINRTEPASLEAAFDDPVDFPSGALGSADVVLADLNGDGQLEAATSNEYFDTISIFVFQ